ncbi:MAG: hypothetical protein R2834_01675 [Rhodothermales bacterium]
MPEPTAFDLHAAYRRRCDALIDFFADREADEYLPYTGLIEVAARLYRGRPLDQIVPDLVRLMANPHGDMFWMYPMTVVACLGENRLPESIRRPLRALWRTYTPYRGDTENHWAMYYASLFLMTELYPDEPGDAWFNGRSSAENHAEARDYLLHWIDFTTREGQGEFDSPHYLPFFITPMAMLYAFTRDARMRLAAEMMLDYLIADFAVDTLDGLYAGAFSRIYPIPAVERWKNGSTTFAHLLFGNTPFSPQRVNVVLPRIGYRPHGVVAILAMSGYTPHPVLHGMATDRSRPFISLERKRTRTRIRWSSERHAPVYKYMFMRREYAMGSIQGGLLQPIQQHTWEVLWATADPHEGFNVFFTIHPYSSPHEMGMYFGEEPKLMTENVVKAEKDTYDSPDKLTGGSPFEHVYQHADALIVLYDIPEGTRFPHVSGYLSPRLSRLEDDASGWLFLQGGDAYIAVFPLAPCEIVAHPDGSRRLHCEALRTGFVVQTAPAGDYASFEAFTAAIRALELQAHLSPEPRVRFTTRHGSVLDAECGEPFRIDGKAVDYAGWPLFSNPFLRAGRGSRRLEMRYGSMCRTLDFDAMRIIDQVEADDA